MTTQGGSRRVRPRRVVVWFLALLIALISAAPIIWV